MLYRIRCSESTLTSLRYRASCMVVSLFFVTATYLAAILKICENRINNLLNSMKAISLFTGAGGMDVGFQQAGFNIIWANELMPHASATYALNHPKTPIQCGDLRQFMRELPKEDDIFCVFGGPPCQGFSVAGKMDLDDERSQLVFSFMDVVEKVNPKVFVMENVKALGSLAKFSHIREKLLRQAANLGYDAEFHILNAKDFGVPQTRERMFFIGIKRDAGFIFDPIYLEQYKQLAPTVKTILEQLGPAGTEINPLTCKAKITLAGNPIMRNSPYAGMIFNGMGRPLRINGISNTLPASMGGNKTPIIDESYVFSGHPSWIEWYHSHLLAGNKPLSAGDVPSTLRRLTVKEAATLQSFPLNYQFSGPISSQYTQIGNAVPCLLAKAIGASIMDVFKHSK